jgi:hypothetical protein
MESRLRPSPSFLSSSAPRLAPLSSSSPFTPPPLLMVLCASRTGCGSLIRLQPLEPASEYSPHASEGGTRARYFPKWSDRPTKRKTLTSAPCSAPQNENWGFRVPAVGRWLQTPQQRTRERWGARYGAAPFGHGWVRCPRSTCEDVPRAFSTDKDVMADSHRLDRCWTPIAGGQSRAGWAGHSTTPTVGWPRCIPNPLQACRERCWHGRSPSNI